MNSSDNPLKKANDLSQRPHFVAEGGVPYSPDTDRDPFEALNDLMLLVEALSPTWPPREITKDGQYWRL